MPSIGHPPPTEFGIRISEFEKWKVDGPLKPSPAHPGIPLRGWMVVRLRGGIRGCERSLGEGGGRRTEGRGRKTEDGRRETGVGGQGAEDGGRRGDSEPRLDSKN